MECVSGLISVTPPERRTRQTPRQSYRVSGRTLTVWRLPFRSPRQGAGGYQVGRNISLHHGGTRSRNLDRRQATARHLLRFPVSHLVAPQSHRPRPERRESGSHDHASNDRTQRQEQRCRFNHDGIQTIQRLKQVKCAVDQRADRAPPAHAVHAENAFTASGEYSWRYHSSKAARSAVSATTARLPLSTVLRVFPRHLRSRPFQSLLLTVKTRLT